MLERGEPTSRPAPPSAEARLPDFSPTMSAPATERRPAFPWNRAAAALLLALSLWTLAADLAHEGHFLLQGSPSALCLGLFTSLWMFAALVFAVFPKRVLFVAVLLVSARLSFAWPVLIWTDLRTASLLLDGALAALAATYLLLAAARAFRHRPRFRALHSVAVGAFALLVSILSLPAGLLGLASVIDETSSGYVRFSLGGIDLTERVFEKEGRRVHLIGMAHVADGHFYEALNERLARPVEGRRLVLLEGVSDREGILPESFASGATYRNFAEKLGLAEQRVGFSVQADGARGPGGEGWSERGVDFRNADIDVADLSPAHREGLVAILTAMEHFDWRHLFTAPAGIDPDELEDLLVEGLVRQRNRHLMEILAEAEDRYAEIFIPWGAAHLPDLERRLIAEGYRVAGESRRRGIDFGKFLSPP